MCVMLQVSLVAVSMCVCCICVVVLVCTMDGNLYWSMVILYDGIAPSSQLFIPSHFLSEYCKQLCF